MIRPWWDARESRERRILSLGGAVVVALLGWAFVWHPIERLRDALRQQVEAQRADLAAMRVDAAHAAELRARGERTKADRQGKSLLALADATARGVQLGNALKRVEPVATNAVRVNFEAASFDAIADWLDGLARDFGVQATDFSADRVEGVGLVNARVTLQEPR